MSVFIYFLLSLSSDLHFTLFSDQEHAQIALTCPLVSQALTASIAPLLTLFMIHNVTFGGSLSVLAGVLSGLTITPYLLWRYGAKLRSKSLYAIK